MSALSSFLIGGAKHAIPLLGGVFRKYYAAFTTTALIQGITDVSHKAIVFKIGARFKYNVAYDISEIDQQVARMVAADPIAYRGTKKRKELRARLIRKARTIETSTTSSEVAPPSLACPPTDMTAIQQPYRVAEAIAADFSVLARKYTGITGQFNNADMSGLVSRLASGLAHFTLVGELTMDDLAGGNELKIVAAGNHTTPLVASNTSIWVPRNVDSLLTPNALAALTAAACAIGSTLVTDIVPVDSANAPIMPSAQNNDLAEGIYQALRIIGGNMEHNSAGALYAYALAHGIHNVVTVAGMTDEAGFMRSVLRTTHFTPSYGGISIIHDKWGGLPKPSDLSLTGWTAVVDSVALATAACVAISDPCMSVGGRTYPSTFSGVASRQTEAGSHTSGDENDAATLCSKIGSSVPAFSTNYIKAITRALDLTFLPNGHGAIAHLTLSFSSPALLSDRHLCHASVSPFYWIEPTGIITFDCSDFTAVAAGYGPLASISAPGSLPFFDRVEVAEELGEFCEINIGWRSARTCGLAIHLGNHVLDGLANARVVGGDCNAWAQVGGASKTISKRMDDGDDLASYLWSRSDVGVPAPGEALYLGEGLSLVTRHATMDTAGWVLTNTHFPMPAEIYGSISVTVSTVSPYEAGDIGPDRHAARAYTHALKALDAARVTGGMRTAKGIGRVRKTDIPLGGDKRIVEVFIPPAPSAYGGGSAQKSVAAGNPVQTVETVTGKPQPQTLVAGPKGVPGQPATSRETPHPADPQPQAHGLSTASEAAGTT
jgi:hypothetical protein